MSWQHTCYFETKANVSASVAMIMYRYIGYQWTLLLSVSIAITHAEPIQLTDTQALNSLFVRCAHAKHCQKLSATTRRTGHLLLFFKV